MGLAASLSFYLGYCLIAFTFVKASVDAFRRHDRARLDVVLLSGLLLLDPLLRFLGPASVVLRGINTRFLPFALLRLGRQFREVHRGWIIGTACVAITVPLTWMNMPDAYARAVNRGLLVYVVVAMGAASQALLLEARRSSGVRARRTYFAAIGTLFLAGSIGLSSATGWFIEPSKMVGPLIGLLQGLALICYFFAFGTPRTLLSRWRRAERSKYFADVMDRDPEERGRRAADDLFQGAVRGAGGAITFVALRHAADSESLEIKVASKPALVGRLIRPGEGLVTRVVTSGRPAVGGPADCEPAVTDAISPAGVTVLVAPVIAAGKSWGVVVVAQRRGSLFPEDDLEMLAQIGHNAATALDHAQLLEERREQDRLAAERRLRQVESRVDLMLDSIKDYAMFVLDSDGRVAAWHPGARHVFGHTAAAVAGSNAAPLYGVTSDEFTMWLEEAGAWGRARREGRCVRADGSTFVGTTVVRPLAEDGQGGFVVVTHDVTDRRTLEERLRQGQKMEAIGQLAGGVAHDFNNLLTAILGYADWLSLELAGDPRRDHVAQIQKAADRAADLTRQLLTFGRRQLVHPAAVSVSEIVADLLPILRRLVGKRIEVIDQTLPIVSAVMGDRSQLEQIMLNLTLNARDAMPDGGTLTIRTSDVWLGDEWSLVEGTDQGVGPHVLLEVIDTGIGMDDETRRRVFEPFFTTKDVGHGTGLGLSTVYGAVQQMAGLIEVDSVPEQGTRFRLYFPQTSALAVATPMAASAPATGRGTETVLLVEDEDVVRSYMTHLLESHGYRVIGAEHASAALARMDAFGERVDLVISDVVIPGSTGPELVRLLHQARPGLSALFISGYSDVALARHAHTLSATQLLLKPFSSTELLVKIRQVLSAA